ncbi:MAG: hypothetical protein ACREN5_06165, partial [Gemmatimonadales bacterium]
MAQGKAERRTGRVRQARLIEGPPLPAGVPEELDRMAGRALDAKWFLGHAIAALRAGDSAAALEHGARAKDCALRSPTVRETLGLAAYASGDFKQSLGELQAFRRMTGARIHDARIADCYRGTGRPMRAVEFLDQNQASDADAARVRAGALADAGDEAGARAALQM